jgi:hypothetical protein
VADYALNDAPDGWACVFSEPTRNLEQSAKFHAICGDLAKQLAWAGSKRSLDAWKFLLISGHSIATNRPTEIVPGLEGELLNIRESSASMSKARMASLIDYCIAFCAQNNVNLTER